MKSTHTPGPWKATGKEVGTDYEATHGMVASIIGMPNRWETEANARLIAAAPDLLAACKELLGHVDPCPNDVPMSARCRICNMHPTKHEKDCVVLTALAAIAKAEGGVK